MPITLPVCKFHGGNTWTSDLSMVFKSNAMASSGAQEVRMLQNLTEVPWRRIDVSFAGASMPNTAHNLIQVPLSSLGPAALYPLRSLLNHWAPT